MAGPIDLKTIEPAFNRPIWLWNIKTGAIIWANGPGVEFWQSRSLEHLQNKKPDLAMAAWKTVTQLTKKPLPPQGLTVPLRFTLQTKDPLNKQTQSPAPRSIEATALCRKAGLNGHTNAIVVEIMSYQVMPDSLILNDPQMAPQNRSLKKTVADKAAWQKIPQPQRVEQESNVTQLPNRRGQDKPNLAFPKKHLPVKTTPIKPGLKDELSAPKSQDQQTDDTDAVLNSNPSLQDLANRIKQRRAELKKADQQNQPTAKPKNTNLDQTAGLAGEGDIFKPDNKTEEKEQNKQPLGDYFPKYYGDFDPNDQMNNRDQSHIEDQNKLDPWQVGQGDMASRQELLKDAIPKRQTTAICSLDQILHADDLFVEHFGYPSLKALKQDGLDWILPAIRPLLMPAFVGKGTVSFTTIGRNRAGRKFNCAIETELADLASLDIKDPSKTLLTLRIMGNEMVEQDQSDTMHAADPHSHHPDHDLQQQNQKQPLEKQDRSPAIAPSSHIGENDLLHDDLSTSAAMAHEMRLSLNHIIGFSDMILTEQFGPLNHDKYLEYIRDIHQSARHMQGKVEQILEFAKVFSGQSNLDMSPVDLNQLIRKEIELISPLAKEREIILRSDLQENIDFVPANEGALSSILSNLIANGINYNRPHGSVKVTTAQNNSDFITIEISDTGYGMDSKEIEKAIQPFVRLHDQNQAKACNWGQDIKNKQKGTGLGLPLAKRLTEAMNAQFSILSTKNKGTTAELRFPIAPHK